MCRWLVIQDLCVDGKEPRYRLSDYLESIVEWGWVSASMAIPHSEVSGLPSARQAREHRGFMRLNLFVSADLSSDGHVPGNHGGIRTIRRVTHHERAKNHSSSSLRSDCPCHVRGLSTTPASWSSSSFCAAISLPRSSGSAHLDSSVPTQPVRALQWVQEQRNRFEQEVCESKIPGVAVNARTRRART